MKYIVIFAIKNTDTLEIRDADKMCSCVEEAQKHRDAIRKTVNSNEKVHCDRMFPVVTCQCGCEVVCYGFTNTCECGCDYNFNGSLLAPREQWGEETGEHWSECY